MRLSIIFELLLIFLLIAFAAYARVIDSDKQGVVRKLSASPTSATPISFKQAADNVNKYCICNENICNCCRDFHIPLVRLSGPGCASLQYLQDNKLAMQLSIGDNILSSNVINGNNPKPVCVNLPGGFSKFCGKIYSIKKEADKHFKACLGLELRSSSELEASLRVSCFRFGPDGLKLRPAEPLPPTISVPSTNTDDDYDDIFGLDDDEEDDDDDEEDDDDDDDDDNDDDSEKVSAQTSSGSAAGEQQNQEQEADDDEDDDDLLGLSALLDIFTGDDGSATNKKTKPTASTPLPTSFTIPILALTSTSPAVESHSSESPVSSTSISSKESTTSASIDDSQKTSTERTLETAYDTTTISNDDSVDTNAIQIAHEDDAQTTSIGITETSNVSSETEKVTNVSLGKKSKVNSTEIKHSQKKKVGITVGSTSKPESATKMNKLVTKPHVTNQSIEVDDSSESAYDEDESDEDEQISDDNDNDSVNEATNENDKTANTENEETSNNDYDQSYEESDEDDDKDTDVEVMSSLLEDDISTENTDNRKKKIKINKIKSTSESLPTKSDYDYELSDILARKYSHDNKKGVKRKMNPKTKQNPK